MAEVVGGTIGAVVGFAVGGPAGAQWGWAIGAAVGTSFTTIKAPKLGDLATVSAGEGGGRARVYGTFRPIGGQVVWAQAPRVIRRKQSGKGAPKQETNVVLRSYAIGICEGPIIGVRRIWRNNELVYDVRPGSEILAESAKWLEGKTILAGEWDQMPHPTIEAVEGANAPAMRGTALLVVTDEETQGFDGGIPAYQFEVGAGELALNDVLPSGWISLQRVIDGGSGFLPPGFPFFSPFPAGTSFLAPAGAQSGIFVIRCQQTRGNVRLYKNNVLILDRDFENLAATNVDVLVPANAQPGDGFRVEGLLGSTVSNAGSFNFSIYFYSQTLEELGIPDPEQGDPVALAEIVGSIMDAAGVDASRRDLSALNPAFVPGFATSPDYTAASALLELSKIYFFDAQDADGKVRMVSRGGDFRAILTEDEFVDGENEPEADTTRDSISVPRLLHLSYFDVNGGQGTDKQFSERQISPRTDAPTVLSTPVVLDAETAAKSLRVQHQVMEEELRGELVFGISDQRITLAESDVVVIQYRGRSQRARITKVVMNDGWQQITCLRDRQSAYNANPQAVPPAVVTRPPSTIVGATRFAFLDIPALTQAGDVLGYHIATSGEVVGWRGAAVERQEGTAFSLLATDGVGTVMGTLTAALPLASEWYPDETNTLAVQLARSDDELEAIDTATWLARGNAAAIVRADGTAEIVQFRNAVETSPGVWALSGLQRGRLNSGASAHAIGATFVLLDGSLFVQTGSERLASTLTHRAYSVGNLPSSATAQARTWTGRSQREWPPIIETAARVADTVNATWTPRHRFGSDENPVASSHFDGWQVDATSGGTTRTATVLTPTASIDVTGLTNPITVTVRGRNRLAGLGDPATRIIP
jgi:hypothetical protein